MANENCVKIGSLCYDANICSTTAKINQIKIKFNVVQLAFQAIFII